MTRIALVLWVGGDAEGVASVDIMPRGQTITSDLHIQTLKTLVDACYETLTSHTLLKYPTNKTTQDHIQF